MDTDGDTLSRPNKHEWYYLNEQPLYGSSRVGVYRADSQLYDINYTAVWNPYNQSYCSKNAITITETDSFEEGITWRIRGKRIYEMSNHLGNVLTTFNDRKLPTDTNSNYVVDYFEADILTANDYYPFGMLLTNRTYSAGDYRFGFNGKEMDNEVSGQGNQYDYGFRIYNPRLGKFLSVDPLTKSYPWYTPYQFAGNKPIWAIDIDGLEEFIITSWQNLDGTFSTKVTIIKADGPLKVNYYQRIWNDDVVERDWLAEEGFRTLYLGSSTASNPYRVAQEGAVARYMLSFHKPDGPGRVGDKNHDNMKFISDFDPTTIPIPEDTPIPIDPPVEKPKEILPSEKPEKTEPKEKPEKKKQYKYPGIPPKGPPVFFVDKQDALKMTNLTKERREIERKIENLCPGSDLLEKSYRNDINNIDNKINELKKKSKPKPGEY